VGLLDDSASVVATDAADYWAVYQPGLLTTREVPGTAEFFREVEQQRYRREPHIPSFADFPEWGGCDVLEAGCGIGTDGAQFARYGARYTGLDQSDLALNLARRGFEVRGLSGRFVQGSVAELPFEDESFDLVYSFGVIHHSPDTERAVREFHRVLRPNGVARVMVYHRGSLNYYFTILALRRTLLAVVLIPGFSRFADATIGEDREVFVGHRALIRRYGIKYVTDKALFLSHNTDGPGNPLSKVYSRRDAARLFSAFSSVELAIRYLNIRRYPAGDAFARTRLGRRFERRVGWHLCISSRK
jgi:SAM-dependent methyltransferase